MVFMQLKRRVRLDKSRGEGEEVRRKGRQTTQARWARLEILAFSLRAMGCCLCLLTEGVHDQV